MFNALYSLLSDKAGVGHMAAILMHVENLISLISADYLKDGNSKDAAIDALIQILQEHKTQK